MTATLQREARQLTELLLQQRDLYQRLRELAAGQSQAVQEDKPESLLRILAQRQRLIHELTQVNALIEPFRSRWDQLREGLEPAERVRVAGLVDEVQGLLAQILQQDEGDCDMLKKRSGEIRNEAASIDLGRKVNAAYAKRSYGAPASQYIDCRDEGARQ